MEDYIELKNIKFENIKYNRVDYENYKEQFLEYIHKIEYSSSFDEVIKNINSINILRKKIETMRVLVEIKFSLNTKDESIKKENKYWDEMYPYFESLNIKFYQSLLNSRFKEEIIDKYGKQFYRIMECKVGVFSDSIIELLKQENKLMSEYTALLASFNIEFNGEKCNLSKMFSYASNLDEKVRRESIKLQTDFFEENEKKFDYIFDKLVKIRHDIAKKLGYESFLEVGYMRMLRTDYDEKDIEKLRKKVIAKYIPMANDLYSEQSKRIGVEKIDFYNEKIEFLDGNAKLIGDSKYIIKQGQKMYDEISDETSKFYRFLTDNNLFDIEYREGKAMGGYCTIIPDYNLPYIFANFNGTVDDIDVLTHEMGHAFQVYMSSYIDMQELVFPTLDSCEIHSMSMEFFTYPWMHLFFGKDIDKYKKYHYDSAIKFIPYGTLVDHFQHIIYKNVSLSPDDRKKIWSQLEKVYLPEKDYVDLDILNRGGYWFRQGHIFKDPFYYIDYVLAQICALQFYELMQIDYKDAWKRFLKICKVGGIYSFKEIVDIAGLENPF